jgi:two-component system alkaline phosphatase synthesis response regulator PhoP
MNGVTPDPDWVRLLAELEADRRAELEAWGIDPNELDELREASAGGLFAPPALKRHNELRRWQETFDEDLALYLAGEGDARFRQEVEHLLGANPLFKELADHVKGLIPPPPGEGETSSEMVVPPAAKADDGEGPGAYRRGPQEIRPVMPDDAIRPGPRIVIADDNLRNVELLKAYLSDVDCEIQTAFDGEETLRAVNEFKPDLVLLDVMMPRLSGFEVCRKLRANPATREILILMVTALNEASDFERGVQAGTDDFLTKPVNKVELLCRVKSLLRVRHLKSQLNQTLAYLAEAAHAARESDSPRAS